jgi:hypothetical protein
VCPLALGSQPVSSATDVPVLSYDGLECWTWFQGNISHSGETQMMSNRREMLCQATGALTGLAAVGRGLVSRGLAQEPPRRREVVVNGKRVRTVDLHAHCHVPEANALMGLKVNLQTHQGDG